MAFVLSSRTPCGRALWATCSALCLILSVASGARAEDMTISPALSVAGSWNSNPLMRTSLVEDLYGVTTTPSLSFAKHSPIWDFVLKGRAENNVFDQSEFNTTDFFGSLDLARRTERLEVRLVSGADYDTTRTSELTDFGLSTELSRHLGYQFKPSVSYALSPVSKIGLNTYYVQSNYEKDSRTDYHTISITPSYQRNFTERYAGVLSMQARRYETDSGIDRTVDSLGPSVGVIVKMTPEWTGDASVGQQATREKLAGTTEQDWTWSSIFAGGLKFEGEQDLFNFRGNRSQQSYNNGTDTLLTSFSIDGLRKINSLFTLRGGLGYQFSDSENTTINRLDKKYTGSAGLTYNVTQTVGVTTSYNYRQETFTNNDKTARQNIVRLGVSYKPDSEGLW